ncbi:MAG: carbonic anhydrase [Flexistipes sinusarabici]|uniref:Carbonic anhydrase n=1 Tax=Flexistipes sinusarabici TaxID=2352 RepID=A0A5D0MR01_FLESI|nr:ATP-grasp fold amidoligase family protein [Flexistipes sinusarabici]TYB33249.1 MAG: carbonic anhydrase [Flexistipes sinusarabici]
MNYKKIIKSRELRLKILSLLNWIPDKLMIKIQYRVKTWRKLNLKNPKRFTEKLQWYKLYYRDPLLAKCSDKYLVRNYVEEKGLSHILNELYGVYNDVDEIDFSGLPDKFVLKSTNGGGGNNIIICKDKNKLDVEKARKQMKKWLIPQKNGGGREWVYYRHKPKIIAEKYIESGNKGLIDYKFFCFNGDPKYLYVISERDFGNKAKLGIFDIDFNKLNYYRKDESKMIEKIKKPKNYEEMIETAKLLSEDFPHVRVDLYNLNGKIIFGELTFFDGSGFQTYEPDEFDFILGEEFILPKRL